MALLNSHKQSKNVSDIGENPSNPSAVQVAVVSEKIEFPKATEEEKETVLINY